MALHTKKLIIEVQDKNESAADYAARLTAIITPPLGEKDTMDVFTQFTTASDGRQTCNITIVKRELPEGNMNQHKPGLNNGKR